MRQPALSRYSRRNSVPGRMCDSNADLIHAAGDIGTTIFHPVGTAKMGLASDPLRRGGRTPARARASEIAGDRRLGDADHTSGNTNTPTIMIAAKGADMVLEDAKSV